ncbi:MAG: hypothetical protein WCT05_06495 [Lentisphaeria bacterium]
MTAFHFTQIADAAVEKKLASALAGIAADMAALPPEEHPMAVYLGGGYGRGDGGVALKADGTRGLYNDLDLFVVGRNFWHCRRINRALQKLQYKWTEMLQVEVEFSSAKTPAGLARIRDTLMFQELLRGHQQIFGETDVLQGLPRLRVEDLSVLEGFRLLLNRGAGLLFAAERILSAEGMNDEQRDFAVRNLHKTVLGCGDALLLIQHRYCWKSSERLVALKELQQQRLPELPEWYAQSLAFKALPQPDFSTDLLFRCEQVRQLWQQSLHDTLVKHCGSSVQNVIEIQQLFLNSPHFKYGNPLKNALRWLLKTGHPWPLRQLTTLPLLRVLLELCDFLFEKPIDGNYINFVFFRFAKSYRDFVKHWGVFN